jgi:hypothetical protein
VGATQKSVRGRCQSVRLDSFGIPTLESGNNTGTLRVPVSVLPCFRAPLRVRKFLKFQIKVLCHGRGHEFESRRPRQLFNHLQTLKDTFSFLGKIPERIADNSPSDALN